MTTDGTKLTRLTNNPAADYAPDVEPRQQEDRLRQRPRHQ